LGVRDAGAFLVRSITGGLGGGLLAAAWAAVYAGLVGLPLWSPLAWYHPHYLGLSPRGVATGSLAAAVAAGVVWQVLVGMAVGALYALVAGTFVPPRALRRYGVAAGAGFGLAVWALARAAGLSLASPGVARDLSGWAVALAFALTGAAAAATGARAFPEPSWAA
jgi:hypothetical protein